MINDYSNIIVVEAMRWANNQYKGRQSWQGKTSSCRRAIVVYVDELL